MSAKKLSQYNGTLTADQVVAGMNAALRNAKRLADDATLLLEQERHPSAAALAILSIEESGKLSILRRLASTQSMEDAKKQWREYRSHTKKNAMWAFLDLFKSGARRLDQFAPLFRDDADHPYLLDQVKQIALYSDCHGSAHWSEPSEVIGAQLSRSLVFLASLLARGDEVTPLELELWLQHVGPYLNGDRSLAEAGVERWYSEMQRHGLVDAGPNEMSQFIHLGVGGSHCAIESES